MYICQCCNLPTATGYPLQVVTLTRQVRDKFTGLLRTEIAKEIPVCLGCKQAYKEGVPFEVLHKQAAQFNQLQQVSKEEPPKPQTVELAPLTAPTFITGPVLGAKIRKAKKNARHAEATPTGPGNPRNPGQGDTIQH